MIGVLPHTLNQVQKIGHDWLGYIFSSYPSIRVVVALGLLTVVFVVFAMLFSMQILPLSF